MVEFRCRRLINIDPIEGVYNFSLITYSERPYFMKAGVGITQYQKFLEIDLWLCVIRFKWLTKEVK